MQDKIWYYGNKVENMETCEKKLRISSINRAKKITDFINQSLKYNAKFVYQSLIKLLILIITCSKKSRILSISQDRKITNFVNQSRQKNRSQLPRGKKSTLGTSSICCEKNIVDFIIQLVTKKITNFVNHLQQKSGNFFNQSWEKIVDFVSRPLKIILIEICR